MIKANPQCECNIEINFLKHSIKKWNGFKSGAKLYLREPTRMILTSLYQNIPTSFHFLTLNIKSINLSNQSRINSVIRKEINQKQVFSLIDKTEDEAIAQIAVHVINRHAARKMIKRDKIVIIRSIDAVSTVKGA